MRSVNEAVRDHEIGVVWDYQSEARRLHEWFAIFNDHFFDGILPTPFLTFDRKRACNLGHYRPGRNCVGANYEINLNTRHLDLPLFRVLGTLLHEMVHEWQQLHGAQMPTIGYHNKEFTGKCAALGIHCTGGFVSHTTVYQDPFLSLLAQHGVAGDEADHFSNAGQAAAPSGNCRMKLWVCGCTRIRAAVSVEAQCLRCGGVFRQQ